MKQTLQYAYSISIFCGVLATAYLMMSHEDSGRVPFSAPGPSFQSRAQAVDPAVSQLLEMENALNNQLSKQREGEVEKRNPADYRLSPIPLTR